MSIRPITGLALALPVLHTTPRPHPHGVLGVLRLLPTWTVPAVGELLVTWPHCHRAHDRSCKAPEMPKVMMVTKASLVEGIGRTDIISDDIKQCSTHFDLVLVRPGFQSLLSSWVQL
ncbi:hypothetical protein NDU88_006382 [Pleurodeles waltl]|uniref:Uncharacterized protein n=1 Tax=Pleurodeles waltl TaxID=8319 RepID=A0AAV7VPM1_PLEWA|nr:hypothetical protein NDU88_006382 [Pleurodeles waltl]